jgi:hypothetical protein
MFLSKWFKGLRVSKWVAIALISLVGFFYVMHLGSNKQELRQIKQEQKKQEVTRDKVKKANENIKSSPDFISDWLRDNGYFRD